MALELHCHEVTVRFIERAVVPPYEGSMIRGAFGRAFKESCCPFPHAGDGCPLGEKCPYGYVFETSPPEGMREYAKNRQVPRPYVFEPPEATKMHYEPGERMVFGFTVIGRAADYMPYFVYAFSRMGEIGVGRKRARYRLERIVARNPFSGEREEIFDGEIARNRRLPVAWRDAAQEAEKLDGERVRVEFLTPTQIRFRGEIFPEAPPFAALVQALLIRIPMLAAVHCGEVWQKDFKEIVGRAEKVGTVRDATSWVSFRRFSSFRGKTERLEGMVGSAVYAGPLQEFLPLLCMGQLTHAGRHAVFGLGRYRISRSR
ncbi:MAG: CRISPR system precrRNA processing endoribonuclease RAMP protein Cas6 [Rubrobacter sp.]|nr:CRISPR system precrRNA processing endoribonuclease RAMP protein Cas6 [Rubrobacter sp.]